MDGLPGDIVNPPIIQKCEKHWDEKEQKNKENFSPPSLPSAAFGKHIQIEPDDYARCNCPKYPSQHQPHK
jgi:hypothetical protein